MSRNQIDRRWTEDGAEAPPARRRILLGAGGTAAALLLAACSSSKSTSPTTSATPSPSTPPSTPATTRASASATASASRSASASASASSSAGGTAAIIMKNFAFNPATLTVAPGTKITFTNQDSVAHTLTATSGGGFDTGAIDGGKSAVFTAPSQPGDYPFMCTIHPYIKGTLTVK